MFRRRKTSEMLRMTSITAIVLFLIISYVLKVYPSTSAGFLAFLSTSIPAISATSADLNLTAFIPFVPSSLTPNSLPWTNSVRIPWCLDHQSYCYTGTLDTGSTGVILSASDLTDYNRTEASLFPIGWEYLTSSKYLYIGNWIPRNLTFPTSSGNSTNITAEIPILAVTKRITCPGYDIKNDGPECPSTANGTDEIDMPVHIVYLGVGFGRQYNGQLQGNPDKNPFLNIIAVNGSPISPSQMHTGYIITDQGVHIGLTDELTQGFEDGMIKLVKQTTYSDDDRDWTQTSACITVGEGKGPSPRCANATILVDSGIAQMYLTVPPSIPVHRVLQESASRPGVNVSVLANNQTVSVRFGSGVSRDDTDLGYSFVVGNDDTDEVVPSQVITTVSNTTAPFVNTGRHFLRRYDVLFDAKDGWYGVRRKADSGLSVE